MKRIFFFFDFEHIFFIQFNAHLNGRKVNIQACIVDRNSNASNLTSIFGLFVRFLRSIWGVCPTRRGVFHETEANQANLCRVVGCFRGEAHQSAAGVAAARGPTPPCTEHIDRPRRIKRNKAIAKPGFHPSLPPKPHEHRPGQDFARKFDRYIPVAAGHVGLWGGASSPRRPQER